jgi:hypothetical protein
MLEEGRQARMRELSSLDLNSREPITSGLAREEALRIYTASVNQPDTLFSFNETLPAKLDQMRALLHDPITVDEANALNDVLYRRRRFPDMIAWLQDDPIAWDGYFIREKFRAEEADRQLTEYLKQQDEDWAKGVNFTGWPSGEESASSLTEIFGPPPPRPTECPDCGSHSILPICYGRPRPETVERARRHEIVLGGCIVGDPRWHCEDCFNSWPEDPPPEGLNGIPEWQQKHLAENAAEFASLSTDATMPPQDDEPAVENYWQRAGGRGVFLLRFSWGRMRIEKRLHLVPLGGTPVYEHINGSPPIGAGYAETHRLAVLAAMRFERKQFELGQ